MNNLIKSFHNQKIIRKGSKNYLVLSLTDHFPITKPELLKESVTEISKIIDWTKVDAVIGEEERGGFIAVCVALHNNLPFSLAKQYPIHLKGEIGIEFSMAYNDKMTIYLDGLKKGMRVVIIDDIIDSGGTMIALIEAVRKAGVEIKDVVAIAEKSDLQGRQRIQNETGILPKVLLDIDTTGLLSKATPTNP